MVDFDSIDDWAAKLTDALNQHVPNVVRKAIAEASPEFDEDYKAKLFALAEPVRNFVCEA